MHSEVDLGGVDPSQAEAVTELEKRHLLKKTSTSNPFLCAADFFLQLGSCKEAVR